MSLIEYCIRWIILGAVQIGVGWCIYTLCIYFDAPLWLAITLMIMQVGPQVVKS